MTGHLGRRTGGIVGDKAAANATSVQFGDDLARVRHGCRPDVHDTIEIEEHHIMGVAQRCHESSTGKVMKGD